MQFSLLGPLMVRCGGQVIPLPSAKQRTLLAALLLDAGTVVTVEELAEALWGRGTAAVRAGNSAELREAVAGGAGRHRQGRTSTKNQLMEYYWKTGAPKRDWLNLGGAVQGSPYAIYNSSAAALQVYVTGINGDLEQDFFTAASGSFTWNDLGKPSGFAACDNPVAMNDTITGDLDVFATAPGGTLEQDSRASGKGWTGCVNRGGAIAGSPRAVSDEVTSNTEIYAPGTAGIGREIAFETNGTWTGWFNLGGKLAG